MNDSNQLSVKKALQLKNCKIVNYDWILDCLSMHANPRKSREGPFLLQTMVKRERAAQKLKNEAKERMENDGVLVNELVNASKSSLIPSATFLYRIFSASFFIALFM